MILAGEHLVLAQSPDSENVYTGAPSLARLPRGPLVASYEWFRPAPLKEGVADQTDILVCDDDGATRDKVAALDFIWASLFVVGDLLYLIGNRRRIRDICIALSADGGEVWSVMVTLFEGSYHCAPTHVLQRRDVVYRAFEPCSGARTDWPHDSWLEGNVIDVRGEMRVLLRTIIDGHSTVGLAVVCGLQDNGHEMHYRFLQYYPMPGAQCKFHILHDRRSELFWATVTIPTDTWRGREPFRAVGFQGLPGNERRILILLYTVDASNWFQAGCVAIDRQPRNSFSCASQLIVGDDLLVLARTNG